MPLLLLFILPILSSLFGGSSGPSGPTMRFDAASRTHSFERTSRNLGVKYWVDPSAVNEYNNRKWRDLDSIAEVRYKGALSRDCENEQMMQSRMMQDAQGFFWTDEDMMRRAREMDMASCRKLGELQRRGR